MARKVLLALFIAHALLLLEALRNADFDLSENPMNGALLATNVAAILGVVTRARSGWFAAIVFVALAIAHYAFQLAPEGLNGLPVLLGIAGAVWCVTDPALRREHGIAA